MLGDTCSPLAALANSESVGVGVAMARLENAAGTVKDQRQAKEIFDFADSSR